MLGAAHGANELPSFPVRTGAFRPLADDELTAQTSVDIPSDVPWTNEVLTAIDAVDGAPPADSVIQSNDTSTLAMPDEEDYREVRGLYLYRVHVKPRSACYSTFELSEMFYWSLQNVDVFRTTEPTDGIRDESYWTHHAEDLFVLMYDAQGVPVPWIGTTRF